MIITLNFNHFNKDNIIIGQKTKNNIIDNSFFYTLNYSNSLFTTNNISFCFSLKSNNIENYYNKYKSNFYLSKNIDIIHKLIGVEYDILSTFHNKTKLPCYKLKEQLNKNIIKFISNTDSIDLTKNNLKLIIKISGIWDDETNYGIIYKFQLVETY
jgi:hypothetical protein